MAEQTEEPKDNQRPERSPARSTIWPGIWALSMQPVIDWYFSAERQHVKPQATPAATRSVK